MKIQLIIFCAFLAGCTSHVKDSKNEYPGDTLTINNVVYSLDSVTKKDFAILASQEPAARGKEIIDDTANVFRDSLALRLHLRNGSDSILVNDTTDENYVDYSYIESCSLMDYWLLEIIYYEGGAYMLMDKNNGQEIIIWGRPVYSPDRKHFVCYSLDLDAGYNYNGIQLFEIKDRKAVHKWNKIIDTWGPDEIRWKGDSVIYIKQYRMDGDHPDDQDNDQYRSMKIYL